jgi:hypothetical protein
MVDRKEVIKGTVLISEHQQRFPYFLNTDQSLESGCKTPLLPADEVQSRKVLSAIIYPLTPPARSRTHPASIS